MSEEKYTPAPWTLEYSTYDVNGVNWEVEGADGSHIAQNNLGGNDRETELANARLIAAAPELLEAAVKLETAFICTNGCPFNPYIVVKGECSSCPIVKLLAAIAKAKGGQE